MQIDNLIAPESYKSGSASGSRSGTGTGTGHRESFGANSTRMDDTLAIGAGAGGGGVEGQTDANWLANELLENSKLVQDLIWPGWDPTLPDPAMMNHL